MAHDSGKIFGIIRKLIADSGPTPTKTSICQALVAERVVGSMGTAHRYVSAFFAADALRAEFRAPEADISQLPDRVRTAFETLLSVSDALRNEVVAAIEDQATQSSTTFGKMAAAHSAAQQSEIDELGTELEHTRVETEALQVQLAHEVQRREAIEAVLIQREAAGVEAAALIDDLRRNLETEKARLQAELDGNRQATETLLRSQMECEQLGEALRIERDRVQQLQALLARGETAAPDRGPTQRTELQS